MTLYLTAKAFRAKIAASEQAQTSEKQTPKQNVIPK